MIFLTGKIGHKQNYLQKRTVFSGDQRRPKRAMDIPGGTGQPLRCRIISELQKQEGRLVEGKMKPTFSPCSSFCRAPGSATDYNIVLVKYNSSGDAQWAQTVSTGPAKSKFYSVAATSDGYVYACGIVNGTGTYNFGN